MEKEYTVTGIYDKEANIVRGKASCFIIPNHSGVCTDFLFSADRYTEEMRKYAELNGFELDPEKTKLIQVWWHSHEGFATDNMYRHSCSVVDSDGNEYRWGIDTPEYMTYDMLKDHKEGEVITIKVPIWIGDKDTRRREAKEAIAELELELNQLDYRYCRFGRFEEALKYVL